MSEANSITTSRICEVCGRLFEPKPTRGATARYCSIHCRQVHNSSWQKPTLANCVICGKEFRTYASYRKRGNKGRCCSTTCAGVFRKNNKQSALVDRVCEKCGKPFKVYPSQTKDGKGRYCSRICGHGQPRVFCNVACKQCGCFIFARHAAKFCSRHCARKWASGPNNHNWKGGRKVAVCIACGKEYRYDAGSRGLVCSRKCFASVATKLVPGSPGPRGKGGKRADLGGLYVRSRWEANWARYLNWLKYLGEIVSWEYEPDTFEFSKVRRGTRFYTPDFKIVNKDGSVEYHEVKGWLDAKSKTRAKRMAKYYQEIKVVMIDKAHYRSVAKKVSSIIPGWEVCRSHGA